jgi:1A family penicillin-binding protein
MAGDTQQPRPEPGRERAAGVRRLRPSAGDSPRRAPARFPRPRRLYTTRPLSRARLAVPQSEPVKARVALASEPVRARVASPVRQRETGVLLTAWLPPAYRMHKREHERRPLFMLKTARRRRARYSLKRGGYYSLPGVRKPRAVPRPIAWLAALTGVFAVLNALVLAAAGFGAWVGYEYFTKDLPSVDNIQAIEFEATSIYDRYGKLLYEMWDPNEGKRVYTNLDDMPRSLIEATIATEDRSFEKNAGVDPIGIIRAAYINITNQGSSGGSTITQQVVRRVLLPEGDERTWQRKIREAILALRMTEKYSKEKILEIYLNEIPYGSLSYGVAAAADIYFGKQVKDLTLAESAMLAGLPQSPGLYDPNINFELARARQRIVLDLMVEDGYITDAEADTAYAVDVRPVARAGNVPKAAPHFVQYVRAMLEEQYGFDVANRGGLKVITTVDLDMQAEAQRIAARQIENLRRMRASNAALVALNSRTGEILAMVGSVDYTEPVFGEVNVAVALRQPGSSFKPLTYATALQRGDFTPLTVLADLPAKFAGEAANRMYIPQNYDGRFHGAVTMRAALANSYNIPAVKVLDAVGVPSVIKQAHRMGISTLNDPSRYGLALTLGGGEVTLLDLTSAYGTFANYGYHVPATPFLKIVDRNGRTLYELDRARPDGEQAMDRGVAYQITDILSDNQARTPVFGPNSPLKIDGLQAAAKTGTTNDWKDSWTMGYTRALAVGVWVGNNDNREMAHVAGAIGAAPIWHDFIETVYKNPKLKQVLLKPGEAEVPEKFHVPVGMIRRPVCAVSGMAPTSACIQVKYEWFTLNNAPQEECTWHRWMPVTLSNGGASMAGEGVPASDTIMRSYVVPPPELRAYIGNGPPTSTLNISNTAAGPGMLPTPVLDEPPGIPTLVPVGTGASAGGSPAGARQGEPLDFEPISGLQFGIDYPQPGQVVSGIVAVTGRASADDFASYRLEFEGPGGSSTVAESSFPPVLGTLGVWNTDGLAPGSYTLRLTLLTASGQAVRREVMVRVGTARPVALLLSPTDGQGVYENEALNIDVWADGGGALVAGVEVYVDGRRIASLTSQPWSVRWGVISGTHEIEARIYTAVGEQASSGVVRVSSQGTRPTPTPTPAPILWISNLTYYKEMPPGVHDVWVEVPSNSAVHHVDIYIDGYPAGFATGPGFRANPSWTPTPAPPPTSEPTATLDPFAAATATVARATAEVEQTRVARAQATRSARAAATATAVTAAAQATAASANATASVVLATTSPTPTNTPQPTATPTFVVHEKLPDPMLGDYVAKVQFPVGRHRVTAIGYDQFNREVGRDEAWVVVK